MKSRKKISEKLLSVLLIHLTELYLYFVDLLATLLLWNLRTDISDPFEDYRAKGNILITKRKKLSEKLLCVL